MKTLTGKYKEKKIEVRSEDNSIWNVSINGISYPDLSADNEESAYENAEIKVDTDIYFKK